METVTRIVDGFLALLAGAPDSWLGALAVMSPAWVLAAVRVRQAVVRRRAFRDFAVAHGLRFAGGLVVNAVEGQWDDVAIRIEDMPRGGGQWFVTTVAVTVEDLLHAGAGARRLMAERPEARLVVAVDTVYVSAPRRLEIAEFTAWVGFALALARAMERDAKERYRG